MREGPKGKMMIYEAPPQKVKQVQEDRKLPVAPALGAGLMGRREELKETSPPTRHRRQNSRP